MDQAVQLCVTSLSHALWRVQLLPYQGAADLQIDHAGQLLATSPSQTWLLDQPVFAATDTPTSHHGVQLFAPLITRMWLLEKVGLAAVESPAPFHGLPAS